MRKHTFKEVAQFVSGVRSLIAEAERTGTEDCVYDGLIALMKEHGVPLQPDSEPLDEAPERRTLPRFKHADSSVFDVPDGPLTKDQVRSLGVYPPNVRGRAHLAFYAVDGKVFARRSFEDPLKKDQVLEFRIGERPQLGPGVRSFWFNVGDGRLDTWRMRPPK